MKDLQSKMKELNSLYSGLTSIYNSMAWDLNQTARKLKGVTLIDKSRDFTILGAYATLAFIRKKEWSVRKEGILRIEVNDVCLDYYFNIEEDVIHEFYETDENGDDVRVDSKCWSHNGKKENVSVLILNDILAEII